MIFLYRLYACVCVWYILPHHTHLRSRRVQDVDFPVRSFVPFDVSPKVKTHSIFANLDIVLREAEVVGHNLEFSAGLLFCFWQRITSITGTDDVRLERKDKHGLKTVSRKINQGLQGHH